MGQIVSRKRDLKPPLTWEVSRSGEHGEVRRSMRNAEQVACVRESEGWIGYG
jgi:hypothetical protein